ncbi:MAG: hypothetical protein Q8O36_08545 [Candidatus Omnitrophota bacterium]|nr:hypothetical protein [Candidatus Omnitrophota bacterium]
MAHDMGQKTEVLIGRDGSQVTRLVTYTCMRCVKRLCECPERVSPSEWGWSKDSHIGVIVAQKVQEELDKRKEM